jgi:hypothetical protein
MRTEIAVTIGGWGRCYVLVRTDAPPRYDGFGTLELYTTDDGIGETPPPGRVPTPLERSVLVDVEHQEWQEGRYRSGLYSYEVVDEDLGAWVQEKLYDRLMGGAK